ncbi:MAG: carboxymuconolactone decarboxylase family protein [Candidatus Methanoperedens sp.]|nr:carboxymuconolactone decarboxylase family protein [Candidatus Methanoperedens sp.]MCZ7396415.1 carboxymuconolactone decarboxylase family protein [Candidatus Methanoperedens sp.]
MGAYENTLKDIEKTLGIVPDFMKALPKEVLVQEWPLFKKYNFEETEIPAKYRELMGLAVAANIKCPYCTLFHKGAAMMNGATEEELAETAFLASYTARWSAIIHAQHYDYDTFAREFEKIGEYLKTGGE